MLKLVCGGKFEDDNGVITSPWYPNPYDDNKICIYDIEAPLGKAIVLNFTNFDIEADCDFDSLRIYDGVDSNATLIGTYCGDENPPVATSRMNHLHLIFSTDSSNTGPGFRATYKFIDASSFKYRKYEIFAKINTKNFIFRMWRFDNQTKCDHYVMVIR